MIDQGGSTRPSVIERARQGDATDFARLYAPLAFSIARKLRLSEHDAEDLMQDAMVALLAGLAQFQYSPARGSFRGLVKTIVRNRITDLLRKNQKRATPVEGTIFVDPHDEIEDAFDREWEKTYLVAALDRVRTEVQPSTYQSFQLAVLQGWSNARVAEALGLSTNQVSQNKHRVMLRLRDHVKDLQRDT